MQEREGYAKDLNIDNFEKNLHHTMNDLGIHDSSLLNRCLYTNVNNTRKHPTIKLVLAITNHKNKFNNNNADSPILTYKNQGRVTPWNN